MTIVRKGIRAMIDEAVANNLKPEKFRQSEGIVIKIGDSRIKLINDAGQRTPAGELKAPQLIPQHGGFIQQTPFREGNSEFIKMRNGSKAVTRKFSPGTGEWKFTKVGTAFYRAMPRRNYVVSVPVTIHGKRKNGTTYTLKSHMPVSKLGLKPSQVPMSLSEDERRALVKGLVKKDLPSGALYEMSDETWSLDDGGSWLISEELVAVDPETGHAEANTILDRRVGVNPFPNHLLFPEAICDEAYERSGDDKLCAPRQISAILGVPLAKVIDEFSEIEDGWNDKGATPRMILEFCRRRGLGCAVIHNETVVEHIPGKTALVFAIHGDHCYFYKGHSARRALMKRRQGVATQLKKPPKESQTPPVSD
jgi:hypothetical protein